MHGLLNDSLERGNGVLRVSSLVRDASMDWSGKREFGAWGTEGVSSFLDFLDILFFFVFGRVDGDDASSAVSDLLSCCERLRYKVE